MNTKEMRQEYAAISQRMNDLKDEIGENDWTEEQHSSYLADANKLQDLTLKIQRAEADEVANTVPQVTQRDVQPFIANAETVEQKISLSDEDRSVLESLEFRHWLKTGTDLNDKQHFFYNVYDGASFPTRSDNFNKRVRELAGLGNKHAKRFIDKQIEMRVNVVGTDNLGGFAVADEMMRPLEIALKNYNSVLNAGVTTISTTTGANLPVPTLNDVANEGAIVAENMPLGRQDLTPFGAVVLGVHKYTSKSVIISLEWAQDVNFNVDAIIGRMLGERIGRIQGRHYTSGTGTNQPQGVVTGATAGVNKANSVRNVTYADLVDLMMSVDPAYQLGARWMFNQDTLGKIIQITGQGNQPIFSPSVAPEIPGAILGKPYVVNQFMDSYGAADRTPLLYGDFSNYYVRNVSAMQLYRQTELYIENGNVGVVGLMRSDAKMVDAGGNPVKSLVVAA